MWWISTRMAKNGQSNKSNLKLNNREKHFFARNKGVQESFVRRLIYPALVYSIITSIQMDSLLVAQSQVQ